MDDDILTYRVSKEDIITDVSEKWQRFARENAWTRGSSPDQVVGRSLWGFVYGTETRYLYRELLAKVRDGMPVGPIPFRCDSFRQRRFLELILSPLPVGMIEITSRMLRSEARDPVKLLDSDVPRSDEIITICSLCKKITMSDDEWVEIDDALGRFKFFELDIMPGLSHGLCSGCYQMALLSVIERKNKK